MPRGSSFKGKIPVTVVKKSPDHKPTDRPPKAVVPKVSVEKVTRDDIAILADFFGMKKQITEATPHTKALQILQQKTLRLFDHIDAADISGFERDMNAIRVDAVQVAVTDAEAALFRADEPGLFDVMDEAKFILMHDLIEAMWNMIRVVETHGRVHEYVALFRQVDHVIHTVLFPKFFNALWACDMPGHRGLDGASVYCDACNGGFGSGPDANLWWHPEAREYRKADICRGNDIDKVLCRICAEMKFTKEPINNGLNAYEVVYRIFNEHILNVTPKIQQL